MSENRQRIRKQVQFAYIHLFCPSSGSPEWFESGHSFHLKSSVCLPGLVVEYQAVHDLLALLDAADFEQ